MAALLFLCLAGCAHSVSPAIIAATQPLAVAGFDSRYVETVQAHAMVPAGWSAEPLKSSPAHMHQVWLSPSGHTAYGIIHFKLPIPVSHELALFGFLENMKMREGEATLLSKSWDANKNCLTFVAMGGLYIVRTDLYVSGLTGWAVYAGTLRNEKIETDELALAERARDLTAVGH
jgi:hypothetical protein